MYECNPAFNTTTKQITYRISGKPAGVNKGCENNDRFGYNDNLHGATPESTVVTKTYVIPIIWKDHRVESIFPRCLTFEGARAFQPDMFHAPPFENRSLRDAIDFCKHERDWANRLIAGDSLLVMNSMLQKEGTAGTCSAPTFSRLPTSGMWQTARTRISLKSRK